MNLRRTCFWDGICLVAFLFSFNALAQSLEELESEVLGGGTTVQRSDNNSPPTYVEEGKLEGSQSKEIPSLSESSSEDDSAVFSKESSQKDAPDEKVYKDIDDIIKGPKSIPFKHIFVVKHQYIFKKGLHELIPFTLGIQPSDSFRKQISMSLSYLYHLSEDFSVEALHLQFLTNLKTGFADDLLSNATLEVERIEPVMSLGAAIQWAPFKGKSATADSIYHFEGYLFLGGGMTQFEVGSSPMMMGGLGVRTFLNRRSVLKFELRDYYDFKSAAGNRLNIMMGAGILLGDAKQ